MSAGPEFVAFDILLNLRLVTTIVRYIELWEQRASICIQQRQLKTTFSTICLLAHNKILDPDTLKLSAQYILPLNYNLSVYLRKHLNSYKYLVTYLHICNGVYVRFA